MRISRHQDIIPSSSVSNKIHLIRETRVMLGADLAILYGIGTSHLNQAVSRNRSRFPNDFMFRLTPQEARALISQSGISKPAGRGGSRHLPYAFTEQGIAMLSSVLRSTRAIQVNIAIMRAFVQMRRAPSPRTTNCARKSNRWSAATMRNSRSFLAPSSRCSSQSRSQNPALDFTHCPSGLGTHPSP
jgi:ORF6N domain